MISYTMAFLAGLLAEGVATKWVQAVAAKRAVTSGIFSTLWAGLVLLGIGESLRHGLASVFWIAGYGLGSYIVVRWW